MRFVAPPGWSAAEAGDGVKTVGRYEILETLGKGAMGVVYKARDPLLDRVVAVKTIVSPRARGGRVRRAYLERFEREAKAAAKMQHPAIVTIFDVGSENGAPFMVLEYLPGESLADRLDRVRMPLGKAVQISLDLASALGFAHEQRIVHRDVKPANVLHAGDSRWKLADFGIARMPDSDLTQVGIFMGTPGYAPPESISRGEYTSQADVFAWGAVLYELLSGRIPYEGPDTRTTNGFVLKNTAVNPRTHDPSIPEPIAAIAMQALEPLTDRRYKTGAEAERALREAWERCLNDGLVSPRALVSTEVSHDVVGKMMHDTESAAITRPSAGPTRGTDPFAVDEEDAPTRIVRLGEGDPTVPQKGLPFAPTEAGETARRDLDPISAKAQAAHEMASRANASIEARARAARMVADAEAAARHLLPPRRAGLALWVVAVFALIAAFALAGYYFFG
jgi:serine/threonine-protein kinase